MFRIGGSAGTGITSGLDQPRKQYAQGTNPYAMNNFAPGTFPGFLTSFGLDLLSRTPPGNIFQTAAAAAKEPFANFRTSRAAYDKGVNERAVNKYNSQTGMLETLLGAQAKIRGSEGGCKTLAKQANDAEIQALMSEVFEVDAQQQTDQALTDEEYAQKQAMLLQRLWFKVMKHGRKHECKSNNCD